MQESEKLGRFRPPGPAELPWQELVQHASGWGSRHLALLGDHGIDSDTPCATALEDRPYHCQLHGH